MGENEIAIDYYNRALVIYKKFLDNKGISSCLNNLGIIYKDASLYKRHLGYYQNSLKITTRNSGIKRGWPVP